jgi:hypothetical protein
MTFEERMRQIDEHFKSITMEEFEANLERAGMGQIKPMASENLRFVDPNELTAEWLYTVMSHRDCYWTIDDLIDYQEFDSQIEVAEQSEVAA